VRVWFHPGYYVDLGRGHAFPMAKYPAAHARLRDEGTLAAEGIEVSEPITIADLLRVHTADYVERTLAGALTEREQRRLGFRWSEALVMRSRLAAGGTLAAARAALVEGVAANLAGGSHHAFADHGEGYCVFNDMAVAIRVLQAEGRCRRVAVVDCDVHQGNGTAAIFTDDPSVFTLSLHGATNYPLAKVPGSLDVALADGTADAAYLAVLALHLHAVLDNYQPGIVLYQAGVDPYHDDRWGRLALTLDGLRRRDALVVDACADASVPIVTLFGGGYARQFADTVEAHCNTVRVAAQAKA
jgi:acetoin utilization deacetylase AcuC-like enzyme